MIFWISAFAVLLAYTIKGLTGFANTLVFSTIMSFFSNNIAITPIEIILGTPSNIFIALRERKGVKWKVVITLAVMTAIGVIPGAFFLKAGNPQLVKACFGVAITLVGLEALLADRLKLKASKIGLAVVGLTAGVMCGMYGIGALLAAYVSRTTDSPSEFRANISIVFLLDDIFRAILYAVTGIFTAEIFMSALKLAPFMVIGMGIGTVLAGKINPAVVKKVIMILLVLSGISLIISNI